MDKLDFYLHHKYAPITVATVTQERNIRALEKLTAAEMYALLVEVDANAEKRGAEDSRRTLQRIVVDLVQLNEKVDSLALSRRLEKHAADAGIEEITLYGKNRAGWRTSPVEKPTEAGA